MKEKQSWDWHTDLKEVPVKEWEDRFNWVQAYQVSPDGEQIAAIVNVDEMAFDVCVNGEVWETECEKAWALTPVTNGGFAVCGASDEEWTVIVNGTEWSSRFDFIWDLTVSPDGSHIGVACQTDMEYGVAVNDVLWENLFESMTGVVMSETGGSAAVVQVEPMGAADIKAFKKGLYAVAVNGRPESGRFLNAWDISFSPGGQGVGYGVRLDRETYGVVQNGAVWDTKFQSVWKPVFPDDSSLLAPVRSGGKWYLYKNGAPFWKTPYHQLWKIAVSPGNGDVAAVVSPEFGRWGVAVNDRVWNFSCDTMVSDILFSADGSGLGAVFKHRETWDVAVNGAAWHLGADKVFQLAFSPDGSVAAVAIEKEGQFQLVVNGKVLASGFSFMADPVVSPDNAKVLLKGIESGVYKRRVISL